MNAPIPNPAPVMNDQARARVRAALKAHPDWPKYRADRGWSMDMMTVERLRQAATDLGLDLFALVEGADAPKGWPQEDEHSRRKPQPQSEEPRQRLPRAWPQVTAPTDGTPPSASDAASLLKQGIEALLAGAQAPTDRDEVRRIAEEAVREEIARQPGLKIVFERDGRTVGEIKGVQHPKMPLLARVMSSRQADGYVPNVWLAGPAGSGKSTAPRLIAEAMGLRFFFTGAILLPHELMGFVDAGGTYHRTSFREAFEHGGVFVFDEVDASDPGALMPFQAALANGRCAFPDGQTIIRHRDCIIIATANTWGLGATADYVGRAKLDAAFLDRFGPRIAWPIDAGLETALAGPHADWAKHVQAARARAAAAGLKVMISPRATMAGAALREQGFSIEECAELTFLANVTADQRKILTGA